MGQSNIPLFAFVDESSNTGHNVFDEAQPDFFTAALITKGNFDLGFERRVRTLAVQVQSESIHAGNLGIRKLDAIADGIIDLLIDSKADFFVSRVEKKYLIASKLFDTFMDSGENAAVAWHHYNLRPLRLMLVFKMSAMLDFDTAKLFWSCLLEPNEDKCYTMLPTVCENLLSHLDRLPDEGSRQVLGEGLKWAALHPKAIQIHTDRKIARRAHFPNLVAFANLLDGLDLYSKRRKKRVACITHDQQGEFEKTLRMFHELYANASAEQIKWAGETY